MKFFFIIFPTLLVFFMSCGSPPNDPEARAVHLGSGIRCPICRGVSIADSPSALAQEMMEIVRQQIMAGKTDQEILKYFEDRYGEWALLEPKAEGINLAVWILPVLFLLGGGVVIIRQVTKRRKIS